MNVSQAKTWNKKQVSDWLSNPKNDILFHFQFILREFDGAMLYELYKLKKEYPKYFYAKIDNEKRDTEIHYIINFTMKLNQLFEEIDNKHH